MKYTSLVKDGEFDRYILIDEASSDNYASAELVYVGTHNLDETFDLQYQEFILKASLKWDGCIDIWYNTSDGEAQDHFCGFYMLKQYTEALEKMYQILKSRIKNWDGE